MSAMSWPRQRALLPLVSAILAGACAPSAQPPAMAPSAAASRAAAGPVDAGRDTYALLRDSFQPQGQATLDRLVQDDTQRECTAAAVAGTALSSEAAQRIKRQNADMIRWPANGFAGEWRRGEKTAQSGVGKQFSDPPSVPSGGNCYACHQLAPEELSYGTIGPSLYRYATLRQATSRAELERYTYGKIYDADAYAACSNMPRFGARGILTEEQIRDLVALLLDPASPVNR